MPATLHWELKGVYGGTYTADAGGFTSAIHSLGRAAATLWLRDELPKLARRASELCPRDTKRPDSAGPHLQDSIRWKIDEARLVGRYGSDTPCAYGKVYALYVEVGSQGRPGAHYLVGALQDLISGGL